MDKSEYKKWQAEVVAHKRSAAAQETQFAWRGRGPYKQSEPFHRARPQFPFEPLIFF